MQSISFTPMPVLSGRERWLHRTATFRSARIAEQKTHNAPGFATDLSVQAREPATQARLQSSTNYKATYIYVHDVSARADFNPTQKAARAENSSRIFRAEGPNIIGTPIFTLSVDSARLTKKNSSSSG